MPDDNLTERKEAVLAREGLSLHEHSVRCGPLSRRLLATLRLCLCNAAELEAYEKSSARPEEKATPRLEREIHTAIRIAVEGLLSELEQAAEDAAADAEMSEHDEEVLDTAEQDEGDDTVTETRRLALTYKARYEEVLRSALAQVTAALERL